MQDSEEEFVAEEEVENPSAALRKLREKLAACRAEKQEYLDGWQRAKADFVNARREEETRRAELQGFAAEQVLADILPVLDSFDMAMGNRSAWESVSKEWRLGMESVASQLRAALREHGVAMYEPLGEPFSPAEHVAIDTEPTEDAEKDHVIAEVLQKGYRLRGKLLRPAKVKIFKKSN